MVHAREDNEVDKARRVIRRDYEATLKARTKQIIGLIQPCTWRPMYKQHRIKVTPIWCTVMDQLLDNRWSLRKVIIEHR